MLLVLIASSSSSSSSSSSPKNNRLGWIFPSLLDSCSFKNSRPLADFLRFVGAPGQQINDDDDLLLPWSPCDRRDANGDNDRYDNNGDEENDDDDEADNEIETTGDEGAIIIDDDGDNTWLFEDEAVVE